MSNKKTLKLTTSLFIIGAVVLIVLMSYSKSESQNNIVFVEVAIRVAKNEVETTKLFKDEWEGTMVSPVPSITFVDLYGEPTAYMFKVVKNNVNKGYITISAKFDFYPVRDGSDGPFPLSYLNNCKEYASQKIGSLVEQHELIYLGGTIYFVKVFSLSGDNLILSLSSSPMVISQFDMESAQLSLEQKAAEIGEKARVEWEKYLE